MPRLLNRILRRPDRGVTPEQNLPASPQLASPSRTGNEGYVALSCLNRLEIDK
jgi:hypothetical protein